MQFSEIIGIYNEKKNHINTLYGKMKFLVVIGHAEEKGRNQPATS
jgi:hypothetical protein